jgi:hypothetical protein
MIVNMIEKELLEDLKKVHLKKMSFKMQKIGKIRILLRYIRLNNYNSKDWQLIEGKESLLVYTDKKNVNFSRVNILFDTLRKF